jgi:hypothetical protein
VVGSGAGTTKRRGPAPAGQSGIVRPAATARSAFAPRPTVPWRVVIGSAGFAPASVRVVRHRYTLPFPAVVLGEVS